jgi:hypothetical protein
MYDASLDQFKNHEWSIPDPYPVTKKEGAWDGRNNFDEANTLTRPRIEDHSGSITGTTYDRLIDFGSSRVIVKAMGGGPMNREYRIVKDSGVMDMVAPELQWINLSAKPESTKIEYERDTDDQNAGKNDVQIRKISTRQHSFNPN